MESYRILVTQVDIDGLPVEVAYADAFVVVREGAAAPSDTDWECTLRTTQFHPLTASRHDLALAVPDGTSLRGAAIVRFSDGHRHLFRGDAELEGFVRSKQ